MSKVFAWRKVFVRPEIFVYLAFVVFTAVFIVLNSLVGNSNQGIIEHYINLNSPKLAWTLMLLFTALLVHGISLWVKAIVKQLDPALVFSLQNLKRQAGKIPGALKNFVVIGIPFFLAFSAMSFALGPLNVFNSTRLRDELLFRWDVFLTGTFPPLSLASIQYPWWFMAAIEFSFFYIVSIMTVFGAYLFLAHNKLFREAAGAFFLSLMIMLAGWVVFPVLSPYDRFVGNAYSLAVPAEVRLYVNQYQPQEEIARFWEKINQSREGLTILPTTALPSAHVVWAVLLVYYSWRVWKWLLLASIPLAFLSTLGTNLFAAHYFVDIPTGIITGLVAIVVVSWLRENQLAYERESIIIR